MDESAGVHLGELLGAGTGHGLPPLGDVEQQDTVDYDERTAAVPSQVDYDLTCLRESLKQTRTELAKAKITWYAATQVGKGLGVHPNTVLREIEKHTKVEALLCDLLRGELPVPAPMGGHMIYLPETNGDG